MNKKKEEEKATETCITYGTKKRQNFPRQTQKAKLVSKQNQILCKKSTPSLILAELWTVKASLNLILNAE